MAALGGGGNGGLWNWNWELNKKRSKSNQKRHSKGNELQGEVNGNNGGFYQFPVKQAVTAGSLALAGIAQIQQRWRDAKNDKDDKNQDLTKAIFSEHDWLRALRMASYGFVCYGPGSYAWYRFLDRCLPAQNTQNLLIKVLLNQIVLGPCVIAVVFAWNNLLQGKLSQLPAKYQEDALPTLLYGFRFWIPVSLINFWVIPLQARVAFMSTGSIFWNFCLSSTMSKHRAKES